ncbi:MAG: FkbM family methyltransferase [Ignavibacteriaceae bacterium]|nr:FkbM family methyltransferase [Ignavibacteriaceae bacterium]
MKVNKVLDNLFSPFKNEIKRQLASRFNLNQIITLKQFDNLKFHCSSAVEYFRTAEYGNEQKFLEIFSFFLTEEDIVWDIGASIGINSVLSAFHCKYVVSFEPDPKIFKRLNENLELNGLSAKAKTYQAALGASKGKISLFTSGLNGNSPTIRNDSSHQNHIEVEQLTVDSVIEQGIPSPTILKLDVEGAEYSVLKGGSKLFLSEKKPRILFIEIHPQYLIQLGHNSDQVLQILKDFGYTIIANHSRSGENHLIAIDKNQY